MTFNYINILRWHSIVQWTLKRNPSHLVIGTLAQVISYSSWYIKATRGHCQIQRYRESWPGRGKYVVTAQEQRVPLRLYSITWRTTDWPRERASLVLRIRKSTACCTRKLTRHMPHTLNTGKIASEKRWLSSNPGPGFLSHSPCS